MKRSNSRLKYRSVSLKPSLVADIETHVGKDKRYRSIADFVSEAARLRLEELEQQGAKKP
jgi:Arc/MetJ-type ribon-helix-helix transcriptional regulator